MEPIVILISSSPAPLPEFTVTPPSSQPQPKRSFVPSTSSPISDDLPPLAHLIRSRPAEDGKSSANVQDPLPVLDRRLKTGSRATEVPIGALTAFRSVRGLVESRYLSIEKEADETETKKARRKPKPKAKAKGDTTEPNVASGKRNTLARKELSKNASTSPTRLERKSIYDFQPDPSSGDEPHPKCPTPQLKEGKSKPRKKSTKKPVTAPSPMRVVRMLDLTNSSPIEKNRDHAGAVCSRPLSSSSKENEQELQAINQTPNPHVTNEIRVIDPSVTYLKKRKKTKPKSPERFRLPRPMVELDMGPLVEVRGEPPPFDGISWVHYVVPPPITTDCVTFGDQTVQTAQRSAVKPKAKKTAPKVSPHFLDHPNTAPAIIAEPEPQETVSDYSPRLNTEPSNEEELIGSTRPNDSLAFAASLEGPLASLRNDTLKVAQTSFTSLVQAFEYNHGDLVAKPKQNHTVRVKRKLDAETEEKGSKVNETAQVSPTKSPVKASRSPLKKRPRTVTAFAIEAHQPATVVETDSAALEFFGPRAQPASPLIPADAVLEVANVEDAKDTTKRKKKAKKISKKKQTSAKPELLSPQALANRIDRQDLLFGTSSQLVLEDDQSTLQQLRRALHESKVMYETEKIGDRPACPLSIKGRARGMWSAAGNDLDDASLRALLEGDRNSTTSYSIQGILSPPVDCVDLSEKNDVAVPHVQLGEGPAEDLCNHVTLSAQHPTSHVNGYLPTPNISFEAARAPNAMLNSSLDSPRLQSKVSIEVQALRALSTNVSPQKRPRGRPPKVKPSENGGGFINATMSSDLGCEKGSKIQSTSANNPTPTETSNPLQPKKPRGRPRKAKPDKPLEPASQGEHIDNVQGVKPPASMNPATQKKDWRTIEEIEDSEPDLTPSPPRRKPRQTAPLDLGPFGSTSQAAECTSSTKPCGTKQTSHPAWPAMAAALYPQVTAVIKNEAPSQGGDPMTWHEKMLMYDPIIADDLTKWLNDRGMTVLDLSRPKKSTTKSVVRGKGKSANVNLPEPEPEYDLVPLEAWMARAWCEAHGVCAVLQENIDVSWPRKKRKTK